MYRLFEKNLKCPLGWFITLGAWNALMTAFGGMAPFWDGWMALCVLTFFVLLGMEETPAFAGEMFGHAFSRFGSRG